MDGSVCVGSWFLTVAVGEMDAVLLLWLLSRLVGGPDAGAAWPLPASLGTVPGTCRKRGDGARDAREHEEARLVHEPAVCHADADGGEPWQCLLRLAGEEIDRDEEQKVLRGERAAQG